MSCEDTRTFLGVLTLLRWVVSKPSENTQNTTASIGPVSMATLLTQIKT